MEKADEEIHAHDLSRHREIDPVNFGKDLAHYTRLRDAIRQRLKVDIGGWSALIDLVFHTLRGVRDQGERDSREEIDRLQKRMNEMHQTMVKITHETPYPEEYERSKEQIGKLTAEVGTLRARVRELETGTNGLINMLSDAKLAQGKAEGALSMADKELSLLKMNSVLAAPVPQEKWERRNEQLEVQLAGCLLAAEGGVTEATDAKQGTYGWSLAFETTKKLWARMAELERFITLEVADYSVDLKNAGITLAMPTLVSLAERRLKAVQALLNKEWTK
jgi:hypothetical protein